MKYELAKKLKDAGFPMTTGCDFMGQHSEQDGCLKSPTLSELIEACGEDIGTMELLMGSTWRVTGAREDGDMVEMRDKNLDTAVAKLWLALNNPTK